eukprot:maker-scaffold478_size161223-snap-gene-0.31 protein:Tk02254 transcript:maker-scaffold478_size161223-snap-gene-0.31-mRNA-1 annotation:"cyclin A3 "
MAALPVPNSEEDDDLETRLRSEYAGDFLATLRVKERAQRPPATSSPQRPARRQQVDRIGRCVEELGLSRHTNHLAVKLLDHFMGAHDIPAYLLAEVAMASLSLAAKMEDKESRVPSVRKLKYWMCDQGQTNLTFLYMEVKLLEYFQWNLSWVTCAHFVDILAPLAIEKKAWAQLANPQFPFRVFDENFREFIHYFMDISLQDRHLITQPPSLLASAILFCARMAYEIDCPWNEALQSATGHTVRDLESVARTLLYTFNMTRKLETKPLLNIPETPPRKQRKFCHTFSTLTGGGGYPGDAPEMSEMLVGQC